MANMSSIRKIEDIVFGVKQRAFYVETKEDGTVITDETRELPVIDFKVSVKTHGTFAGVRYDKTEDKITALSKTEELSLERDNAGFAGFVDYNKDHFLMYLKDLAVSLDLESVQIAGEWIGKKIQKGVGVNKISHKTFVMFGIKFKTKDENPRWAQSPQEILRQISITGLHIRSVFEFQTHTVSFDFNKVEESIKKFDAIRDSVESECPVARVLLQESYNGLEFTVTKGKADAPEFLREEVKTLPDGKYTLNL